MRVLHPPGWLRPKGYANGIAASGRMVFVSGMVGWDEQGIFPSDDFVAQAGQALYNALAVLAEAGAGPDDVVRMTWYVLDRDEYLAAGAALGLVYRGLMGNHYPAMTAVVVSALLEPHARVEIEVTAMVATKDAAPSDGA